jgi:zinc and cadmium transporter
MPAVTQLVLYSFAIIIASLLGGWLPARIRMSHTRTQLLMSFVAGLMLGVAFYHLLPHAVYTLDNDLAIDHAVHWLMYGLLAMFLLLRLFHFHQHGPIEGGHDDSHEHEHAHAHTDNHDDDSRHYHKKPSVNSFSWAGITFGLTIHTIIDGVALGAAIHADALDNPASGLFGLGVFIAVLLHKPLDSMSISSLMISGGWSSRSRFIVNVFFALMCPIGALLFYLGADQFADHQALIVGSALAFSAGVFICISLSDLLPEIQFHSHDRLKLTAALFLGLCVAYGIGLVESGDAHGHAHEHHNTNDIHR